VGGRTAIKTGTASFLHIVIWFIAILADTLLFVRIIIMTMQELHRFESNVNDIAIIVIAYDHEINLFSILILGDAKVVFKDIPTSHIVIIIGCAAVNTVITLTYIAIELCR
jgi:hypothetical protein